MLSVMFSYHQDKSRQSKKKIKNTCLTIKEGRGEDSQTKPTKTVIVKRGRRLSPRRKARKRFILFQLSLTFFRTSPPTPKVVEFISTWYSSLSLLSSKSLPFLSALYSDFALQLVLNSLPRAFPAPHFQLSGSKIS